MIAKRGPRKRSGKRLTLVWTERALSDLEAIGDVIARDDRAAARRWIALLMATAKRASMAPVAGRRVPELGRDDIREVLKRTYRIVYRLRRDRTEVLTVVEGHRLLPANVGRDDT